MFVILNSATRLMKLMFLCQGGTETTLMINKMLAEKSILSPKMLPYGIKVQSTNNICT